MNIFAKERLEKYADTMVWGLETARKGGKIKPYEVATIRYDMDALDLAEAVHRRLLDKKINVVMRALSSPAMEKDFYSISDDRMLRFVPPGELELTGALNGYIALRAPASLTHLKDVDPKKFGTVAVARKEVRELMDRREEQGKFSWTLCMYPTPELAKQAGLTLKQYAAQVEKACFLDEKNPVARWKEIHRDCTEIKKWLYSLKITTIHVGSKNTDLEIELGEKRKFLGISGHNIPSFEIFTSPDWRGTRGTYFADFPSYKNGNYVKDIKLVFDKGRAVKINAGRGEEFVRKMLAMDKGAAQLGEFSLTDRRFSKIDRFMADTLFDENYGGRYGNSHIAVGASYTDTFDGDPARLDKKTKEKLGFNDSSLHWDIVNTEDKTVTATCANGKKTVIYESGEFKY
jgi:aminopeptidase